MYVKSGIHSVVNNRWESLSEFVRRVIREKKLNYREVSRRAGGMISHSTVGDIINNPQKTVTIETLKALAKGLGEPEEHLMRYALGQESDPRLSLANDAQLLNLFERFMELPEEERSEMQPIKDMLAREIAFREQRARAQSQSLDKPKNHAKDLKFIRSSEDRKRKNR